MKNISVMLAGSLVAVSLITGIVLGYFFSPVYQQNMYQKEKMGLGAPDKYVDLRYLNQMASHHLGAILLASQIQDKTIRPEISDLAAEIQQSEPKLIEELISWKREWYEDRRPIVKPQTVNLGPKDDKSDLRFLNALIAHHEAGIQMTQEVRSKSSRAEVLDNADAVDDFLNKSLIMLKGWRSEWYGIN